MIAESHIYHLETPRFNEGEAMCYTNIYHLFVLFCCDPDEYGTSCFE